MVENVIINGEEYVRKSELDRITGLFVKTQVENKTLSNEIVELSNQLIEYDQCSEVNQNTLNELAFLRSRVASLEAECSSFNESCFKVKKVTTVQWENCAEYTFSIYSRVPVDVKPGDKLRISSGKS